jgi:hypothetical protein
MPKAGHFESRFRNSHVARFTTSSATEPTSASWSFAVLASQTRDSQAESQAQRGELLRQETLLMQQQDRLLKLHLDDDIDQDTFAHKSMELRD